MHKLILQTASSDDHTPIFNIAIGNRTVRSCWGPEERHTETVAWFLDNGVPIDEIYDTCMEMTNNAATKALLQQRKGNADEL